MSNGRDDSSDATAVLDREPDVEHGNGTSGPRIRCPLCQWSPAKESRWMCSCLHSWNTFDTGGVSPACLRRWTETQCLSCHRWSAHSACDPPDWEKPGDPPAACP